MKKLFSISAAFLILVTGLLAQSPLKISYQAVIRDNNNQLIANQMVGMQIGVLQGSPEGEAVYLETHLATTNDNGLVTLEIGSGNIVTGNLAEINWANGPYFLETKTDPAGADNYTIEGVSQLLSVPYALYAKESETGDNWGKQIVQADHTLEGTGTSDDSLRLAPLGLQEVYDHHGKDPGAGKSLVANEGPITISGFANPLLRLSSTSANLVFTPALEALSTYHTAISGKSSNSSGISSLSNSNNSADAALELFGRDSVQNAAALRINRGGVSINATGDQFVGVIDVNPGSWQILLSGTVACLECIHNHPVAYFIDIPFSNIYIEKDQSILFLTVENSNESYSAQVQSKSDGAAVIRLTHIGEFPVSQPGSPLKINYMIINKIPNN